MQSFPWAVVSSGHIGLCQHGVSHGLQCGHLSGVVLSIDCRGMSAPAPGALPPLLLLSSWCSQGCFTFFPLTSYYSGAFCSFLNIFLQMHDYLGVCWSHLEPAASCTGQPLASTHRGHPAAPCYQHLDTYTKQTLYPISPYLFKLYYVIC